MSFEPFGFPPVLAKNVSSMGYVTPTPIQAQAIPIIQANRDLVGTAQTGTGKTAAFLLPVMQQLVTKPGPATGALVLAPTRELAQQIHAVAQRLVVGTRLRTAVIVGGVSYGPQIQALKSGCDLVIATPGRLLDHLQRGLKTLANLRTLILDEADQMFDMGFLPDIKRIIAQVPEKRQTLLFSATMPPEIEQLAKSILREPANVTVGQVVGAPATTVTQQVYPVPAHRKPALLEHLLEQWEMPSVLVFTRTKQGARRLTRYLDEQGHSVAELHSNCSPTQRARAMHAFRTKRVTILVATNIAARGLDVRHITHVVNFDVPNAPEEYVHRIGRTGRAGDEGKSLVLVSADERGRWARIERVLRKRIPQQHLTDFDYGVEVQPQEHKKRPIKSRKPVVSTPGATRTKKKPSRGQGRR